MTTININKLQLFFTHALDVDDLLHRITQRIQNIDLPSPGDLTPIAEPLPADVSDVGGSLVGDLEEDGRWVLTLPRYDAPWHPGPVDGEGWQWPPPGDEAVPEGMRLRSTFWTKAKPAMYEPHGPSSQAPPPLTAEFTRCLSS
mgnify:CR=1 FL=1